MLNKPLPKDGDWPCQRPERQYPPPRLLSLLYVLLRDHVPPGELEQVLLNISDDASDTDFTNPHLEALARAHASYLLEIPA